MEMQIWRIYASEGVMGAIHGQSFPIYEGYVPDLMLTVNQVTSFVNKDRSRYEKRDPEHLVTSPQPQPEAQ